MYEDSEPSLQLVLRCEQCNKPFNKQSTLKRHGYYCRSRKVDNGTINRRRACTLCAKGKLRCDAKQPECSRCATKNVECHYPSRGRRSPASPLSDSSRDNESVENQLIPIPESSIEQSVINGQGNFGSYSGTDKGLIEFPDSDFGNISWENLSWDTLEPSVDFINMEEPQIANLSPFPAPSSQQIFPTPKLSIPPSPTMNIRAFVQRPKAYNGTKRVSFLILSTLRSYHRVLLSHHTLPPFIHPQLTSQNGDISHKEPLSNCIGLVNLIKNTGRGTRKLFWKNVKIECERLYIEHGKLDRWEALASLQALAIYHLIRVDEGPTEDNDVDSLLIVTMAALMQHFAHLAHTNTQPPPHKHDFQARWAEWIFNESRWRLAIIFRMINVLVYFEPVEMCPRHPGIFLAPLPSKKQLWEARNALEWDKENEHRSDYGLATNGELVELTKGQDKCSEVLEYERKGEGSEAWDEWCSGMDSFGGLILLAASLVGE